MDKLKPCVGCDGKYFCDIHGNIYNEKCQKIKPYDNGYGYLIVDLRINGQRKHKRVHRLIAEAFLDNPMNFPEINHKDENKHNNSSDNLEWCTSRYNKIYGSGRTSRSNAMKRVWAERKCSDA